MRLNNICKDYGGHTVLTDFSLDIPDGEVTWIMGPSGTGKTTLLRILAGLEEYTGSIEGIDGKRAVMMFQEDRLFEQLSALDNVILGGADKTEAEKWLLKTGLSQQDIKKPASELSGGMKRRTALIRTLLCPDRSLLLMDEPFTGLDMDNRKKAAELINSLRNGRTMAAVTHDKSDAELIFGEIVNMHKKIE